MTTLHYRPEIDGLRAIAVLAVLLCHAGITGFAGGYVGVDVFFVISGFLITSLIVKDLQSGTFSFIGFWERRCRRILPPLFIVMVASFIAGWFLYLPADFDVLGQQMAAQSVFASNIQFKMQAGYFDVASQTKPLLHTWSLSVEEQFYLFFPIVAYFIWQYRRAKITKYLWICAIITFIAAAFIVRNSPSSAFYLLPFRAWELLLGAIVAVRATQVKFSPRMNEILSLAGLAAIFIPVVFYNEETFFPGALALPPCLGTAAIILANRQQQTFVGCLLSMKGPVFIGLISYSLYLWHWPILAYARYSVLYEFTPLIVLSYMVGAFILAVLTWYFVETPIRRRQIFKTTKQAYLAALIAMLMTGATGLTVHFLNGVPQRLSPEIARLADGALDINPHRAACDKPEFSRFAKDDICQLNPDHNIAPDFIVWGDSFADAFSTAFYDLAAQHKANGYIVTAHGCPPILGFSQRVYKGFDCPGLNDRVLKLIDQKNIKTVFLIANWTDHLRGDNYDFANMDWYQDYATSYDHVTMAALKYTIDQLEAQKIKVYVIVDVPYAPFDPPRYLSMKRLYHMDKLPETIPLASYLGGRQPSIGKFMSMNAESDITFIDPLERLCDDKECRVMDNGYSLYFNAGHLSTHGARYMIPLIEPYFNKR